MTVHRVERGPALMIDVFTRDAPPVLTVEPGDTVIAHTYDAIGFLERPQAPGEARALVFPERRGHCLLGPIAVRGARPGQVLAIRLDTLRPDEWGWTRAGGVDNVLNRMLGTADGEPADLLWSLDRDSGTGRNQYGLTVPLAPFLGVTGVAWDEPGTHSTTPPRSVAGGNIDCRELTAGSTLFLPVRVPEALLFIGDGHAAQGDGEVGGTAIECGMTVTLQLEVLDAAALPAVHALSATHCITFGFDEDLNRATGEALSAAVTWLQARLGVDRATALATASVVADLHVTQVANRTWGVHAMVPREL